MLWKKLLTFAQRWAGLLALFLVLVTGTAYALPGANTVFSDDIVDAQVTAADIGSGAVASDEIKNATITANDVATNALGGGRIADNSLTGTDVHESTLSGLDANDTYDARCDPAGPEFLVCDAATTITLDRAMNVLVIVNSHYIAFGQSSAWGYCHLEKNNAVDSSDWPIGGEPEIAFADHGGMNLVDVQNLAPGTYTFNVSCNQEAGDIAYNNVRVAAVELSQD